MSQALDGRSRRSEQWRHGRRRASSLRLPPSWRPSRAPYATSPMPACLHRCLRAPKQRVKASSRTQGIGVAPSAQRSHCVPGALRRVRTDWPSNSGPPYAAHIMRLGPLTHVSRSGCLAIAKPPIFPALFAALGRPGSSSSDILPPSLAYASRAHEPTPSSGTRPPLFSSAPASGHHPWLRAIICYQSPIAKISPIYIKVGKLSDSAGGYLIARHLPAPSSFLRVFTRPTTS